MTARSHRTRTDRSDQPVRKLLVLTLVGLASQLVDGALGMGYGVTSSSLLLLVGIGPALASASVHLSEIGTTLISGTAHHRLGNTDWRLVARLGLPGAAGALLGAVVLSHLSTEAAAPMASSLLLALGLYVLVRFAVRPPAGSTVRRSPHSVRFLALLGLVGGFVDATGGGGWGPVATTTLLARGRTAPRTVIGSVDTSEFMVALAASAGFLAGLGTAGISPVVVGALLAGGLVAAPIAAWLVSRLPGRILGSAVGGLIVLTNARTVLSALHAPGPLIAIALLAFVPVWALLVATSGRSGRAGLSGSSGRGAPRPTSTAAAEPSPCRPEPLEDLEGSIVAPAA